MSTMSYKEYDGEVESTAMAVLDKMEEYPEDYDDVSEAAFETIDGHSFVIWNHNHLDVLKHTREGPEEWHTYVEDGEQNHHAVLQAMAYTAFRADVYRQISEIRDARESLDEAMILIDDYTYSEGVECTYDYDDPHSDGVATYQFECLRGDEWAVYDPDGASFEVISPKVMVENDDGFSPAKILLARLNRICSIREHEREEQRKEQING